MKIKRMTTFAIVIIAIGGIMTVAGGVIYSVYSDKESATNEKKASKQRNEISGLVESSKDEIIEKIDVGSNDKGAPNFQFKLANIVNGRQNGNGVLFISGTVTNSTEKSIVPSHFGLEVKLNNKWIVMIGVPIPEDLNLQGTEQTIEVEAAYKKDLQNFKKPISYDSPAVGHLLFLSPDLQDTIIFDSTIVYKLTCFDIYDNSYISTFKNPTSNYKGDIQYPKHGLKISPLRKDN